MKIMLSVRVILCLIITGSFCGAAEPAKVPWKVAGQLEEACSCNIPCPCWFKSLPTQMTCSGMQVIFIKKGNYGKTKLDGLAVAQFVVSPENKSMFESFGNWKFDNVYIDDKADAAQRAALQELARHFFALGAKERSIQYVPITRKIEGAEHSLTVGTVGACSGHLIGGGFTGAPKVTNPPLADPTHRQFWQGETTRLTYTDAGQNWKFEKSNYMFNEFVVDHKQYEKHAADLAKKLAALSAPGKL